MTIFKHALIFLLILVYASFGLQAQEIRPVKSWGFEGAKPLCSQQGKHCINPFGDHKIGQDPERGGYLMFSEESGLFRTQHDFKQSFAISFLLKMPEAWNEGDVFKMSGMGDRFVFALTYRRMSFMVKIKDRKNTIHTYQIILPFNKAHQQSFDYYLDQKWHHFLLQLNEQKQQIEIWVDGQSPQGFAKKVAARGIVCGKPDCGNRLDFNGKLGNGGKSFFKGSMDNWDIYDRSLNEKQIQRLYWQLLPNRARSLPQATRPASVSVEEDVKNSLEPDQYPLNFPGKPSSALTQIRSYPLPRYKPGHQLMRLYWWMNPHFLGGQGMPGSSAASVAQQSTLIQEELALNWNYYIHLGNVFLAKNEKNLQDKNSYLSSWIALANKYPDIPLAAKTLWGMSFGDGPNKNNKTSMVYNPNLPQNYYLRNVRGNYLDKSGNRSPRRKMLSPAAPLDTFAADGQVQKIWIERIVKELRRPIQIINENGEVQPAFFIKPMNEFDPQIQRDMDKRGIKDWEAYQADRKTAFRKIYADQFMKGIPQLKNTIFTYYGIDGSPAGRFKWDIARTVMTPINGQYYSTPDFYPRWPQNWLQISGAWRGWKWIRMSRPYEIESGDLLYSPFIAAGWNEKPEINIRPGQWLGLLKCLSVTGAEFYYVGVFIDSKVFANPDNYIWQAALPAYAQGINSYYEDILRNGNLLKDEKGEYIVDFPTGDPRVLVCARKANAGKKYIISGTIQPQSNYAGVTPDRKDISIELEGKEITFEVRRQGSTYLYDLSQPDKPLFIQLDSWHENRHPEKWSSDFLMEAELPDWDEHGLSRHTAQTSDIKKGDFTRAISYMHVTKQKKNQALIYSFNTRKQSGEKYNVWVRARNSGKTATICVYSEVDKTGKTARINSSDWKWYRIEKGKAYGLTSLKPGMHQLYVETHDFPLELDKIIISPSNREPDFTYWD